MKKGDRWLLPDGVDEILPPQAQALEQLRRRVLDLFERWGYALVIPPLIEFLDSLLSGIGEDLDLQTFKLTDQASGRMMGVPADITPQAARIDAHRLPTELPQRLCYLGPVLHTKPDKFAGSRNPLQVGAELYGHHGIESDAEVVCLMIEVLKLADIGKLTVELGHMGVFKTLTAAAGLQPADEARLLDALLRKSAIEVSETLMESRVAVDLSAMFMSLLELNGGAEIATEAVAKFRNAPAGVAAALASLASLVVMVQTRSPDVDLHIDLAELRGYRYHTGVMFAAYTAVLGRAIAWGGRYDNIGSTFGRARPATGFSTDLKSLLAARRGVAAAAPRIFAPCGNDARLLAAIETQRAAGHVVVQELPGQTGSAREMGCQQQLIFENDGWRVKHLP